MLEQDDVAFAGDYFTVSSVGVQPRPTKPLDNWLGGSPPAAFRRIGRLGDGWLGSFVTPHEARRGREQIQQATVEAGRIVEPDHFGINLAVSDGEPPSWPPRSSAQARPGSGGADRRQLVTTATSARRLRRHGLTKFVIRPASRARVDDFVDQFVAELLPRQN